MTLLKGIKQNNSIRIVLIAVLYIALTQLTLSFSFPESKSIGVWLPTGLALGMMILYGLRIWPAVAIGSLIAGMMLFLHYEVPFSAESIITITLNATISTLEVVFTYFLINKLIKDKNLFNRTSFVFLFILIVLFTTFLAGAMVTLGMTVSNVIDHNNFIIYLFKYSIANLVGLLILTPLVVSWAYSFQVNFSRKILIETTLFIIALSFILSLLFLASITATIEKSLPFLIMPFIFWLAFRANRQVITLLIIILSIGALSWTINGQGPFIVEMEADSILLLQLFLSIMSMTALIINATVQERTNAEKALKSFNEKLELNVKERTKELKEEINTRKATEEKIKISNKKLRKANSELDNFVYSVSHDLRAPIASVLGLVNLAKKEKSVKTMRNYLEMVAKSAQQQDAFIQDILDLSRNARLEVAQGSMQLEDIVNDIFEQFQFIDTQKSIKKLISVDQKVPFESDKSRVKVIFNNLISNSIRHCEDKSLTIQVDITVDEATASISIIDNGKGIGKKHLNSIFKMFYRGTDTTAGSGLGLYIVKETIDKLRGAVSIDSKENKGTTVTLEIPNLYEKSTSQSAL